VDGTVKDRGGQLHVDRELGVLGRESSRSEKHDWEPNQNLKKNIK
jgi:hypothetical protein